MTNSLSQPKADRTQLRQIITGLREGVIIVNPDQSLAWANEAALAMHGVRSLAELGRTVAEYHERFALRYRNRHPVPPGDTPMARAVAAEVFGEVVVEVTKAGEDKHRVQQVRSLVLTGADGRPDGVALVMEDETERFNAEDRFERAFGANPAPAVIVRLSDMRYVKVNAGYLEMTGFPREALIGKSLHEMDVLAGAEKRQLAVQRLHAGATIPQMEAVLPTAGGDGKTVILAGQPIQIGDEACMLFTFADLHARQRAETALRHSEQRFAVAFRLAPGPMAIIALEGMRLLDVNDAFTGATGWRREEVIGRTQAAFGLWGKGAAHEEVVRLVTQTGRLRSIDTQIATKDGRLRDFLLSAETVSIHGAHCVLTVMQDITERKQTETELLSAIEAVMQDTSWFGQKIVEKLATLTRRGASQEAGPTVADLTPRGRDVLDLIAQGLRDEEIAARLGLTRNTVKNHVSAIYRVVKVRTRAALALWARERGLGTPIKAKTKQHAGKPRRSG